MSKMADATENPVPGVAGLEAEKVSPTWLILQRLGDLQGSIREVRVDMGQMRSDIGGLHKEIEDVHKEIGGLHKEIEDVHKEIGGLHKDIGDKIGEVRKEIGDVRSTAIWWALGTGIGIVVTVILTGVAIIITLKG